jgi:hypothetical protein
MLGAGLCACDCELRAQLDRSRLPTLCMLIPAGVRRLLQSGWCLCQERGMTYRYEPA